MWQKLFQKKKNSKNFGNLFYFKRENIVTEYSSSVKFLTKKTLSPSMCVCFFQTNFVVFCTKQLEFYWNFFSV